MNRTIAAAVTAFIFSLGAFVYVQPSTAAGPGATDASYTTAGYNKHQKHNNKHSNKKRYKKDNKREDGKHKNYSGKHGNNNLPG